MLSTKKFLFQNSTKYGKANLFEEIIPLTLIFKVSIKEQYFLRTAFADNKDKTAWKFQPKKHAQISHQFILIRPQAHIEKALPATLTKGKGGMEG